LFYGRFLIAIKSTTPTIAMATIIAATPPIMYISVGGCAVTGTGDAVGAGSLAWKAADACDG
jgi:hypothetical protein